MRGFGLTVMMNLLGLFRDLIQEILAKNIIIHPKLCNLWNLIKCLLIKAKQCILIVILVGILYFVLMGILETKEERELIHIIFA